MRDPALNGLTDDELTVLRRTMGMSYYQRRPTRNHLAGLHAVDHLPTITGLIDRGLMEAKFTYGPAGREWYYAATEEGSLAALETSWKELL